MNKQLQIIGLAGTNGSGKDSVGQLLSEFHNYLFVSVTELLRSELKKRGEPITRENLRKVSSEWRSKRGLGVLIDMAIDKYQATKQNYDGIAIASLRNPGEVDRVHDLGGKVVWVDAEPRIRYERVQANALSRGRAGEDNMTYEQFLSEEESEMNRLVSGDDTTLNMLAVKERSDISIDNSLPDLSNLRVAVDNALSL
jgi:dephospho-CoA kinase